MTPCQLAIQRHGVDTECRDAFFEFLRSVNRDKPAFEASKPRVRSVPTMEVDRDLDTVNDYECDDPYDGFVEVVELQAQSLVVLKERT